MINTVIQGDCIEEMKRIPAGSVDLVFTSPPYNMNLRIRNGKYCSRQIVKEMTTKYENYSDNMPMDDYFMFNKKVIKECLRVSDLVFYNVQFLTGNKPALFKILGEFSDKIKEFIVWDKGHAQPAIGSNVLNSQFEVIIVFENSNPESRKFKVANFKRGTLSNHWTIKRGKKIDSSHGAVFPEKLAETVIKNFTKKGAVVLDPFAGTGTTAIAAIKTKRKYILIEKDEKYIKVINKRLEQKIS